MYSTGFNDTLQEKDTSEQEDSDSIIMFQILSSLYNF